MLPEKIFHELLKDKFRLSAKELRGDLAKAKKLNKTLEQQLIDDAIVDEVDLYTAAAKKFAVPFTALKGREIKKEVLNLVPPILAQAHQLVAFAAGKDEISLALLDPQDIQTIEFIQRKTGLTPKIFLTTPSDVKDALRRYHADLNEDLMVVQLIEDGDKDEGDLKKVAQELPIINIVNTAIEHAVFEGASDIHIEPQEKELAIRYRIDGILRQVMTLPKTVQPGITARLKILAKLKIDEHMVPQ